MNNLVKSTKQVINIIELFILEEYNGIKHSTKLFN